ncbi:DUF4177 domain-containing protein [Natronolimnohabitans innermongolicus]|uniref:DUF4177 domain-containing protein n=1 Tax=Natronolimnohabitans innermongolicus TaxID=253107 RepID=UPI000677DBCF|nr:DUF4177 domain-containing protein [Natronolimnohabitans innermongolicus]
MTDDSAAEWEYKVIEPPTELTKRESANPERRLNELGTDGWRLVDTISYDGGGTKFLVFERRLED